MKNAFYCFFVAVFFLSLSTLLAKYDYEREFEVFRQIDYKGNIVPSIMRSGLSIGKHGELPYEHIFEIWDDSTIVFSSKNEIVAVDILTGKHKVILDAFNISGKKFIVRKGLLFVYQPDTIVTYKRNNFEIIIDNKKNSLHEQIFPYYYSDFCIAPNDDIILLAGKYNEKDFVQQFCIFKSIDTGRTWKMAGKVNSKYIDSEYSGLIHSLLPMQDNNSIGIRAAKYYENKPYLYYSRTVDSINTWQWYKVDNDLDNTNVNYWFQQTLLTFFPSKSTMNQDTLFAVIGKSIKGDSLILRRSDNCGKNWRNIGTFNYDLKADRIIDSLYVCTNPVFKSVNKIYVANGDCLLLTSNGGKTWGKFRAPVRYIIGFKMIDDQSGVFYTADQKFYYFGLDDNFCGRDGFEYLDFSDTTGLTLSGDAAFNGNSVRLTPNKSFRAGGVFRDKPLSFDKSFECRFGFRMFGGFNNSIGDDSTSPGADGLALVISRERPGTPDEPGGGMGYNGAEGAVAVEFDSFTNNERNDPACDHAAVFASRGKINNNHGTADCLGTLKIPGSLRADYSHHVAKVKYDKTAGTLTVSFDNNDSPGASIFIKDFDLEKYLGGTSGYIGITSSTGNSMEYHEATDFSLCFGAVSQTQTAVEELQDEGVESNSIYLYAANPCPIPATSRVSAKIYWDPRYDSGAASINVYNIYGEKVNIEKIKIEPGDGGSGLLRWDCSSVPNGVYLIRVTLAGSSINVPVIVAK